MRTYSHGIIGWLLYSRCTLRQRWLVVIGAMIPDLILGLGFPFHFFGSSVIAKMFHELFHHSWLHAITELLHSFVVVVPLLVLCYFFFRKYLPFFVGMFSHVIVDLVTHQQWAYNHLFPFAVPPFMSPISYTSLWFTVLEHLFVVVFVIWMIGKSTLIERVKTRFKH